MFSQTRLQQQQLLPLLLLPMCASIATADVSVANFRQYLDGVNESTLLINSGVRWGGQDFKKCCYKAVATFLENKTSGSSNIYVTDKPGNSQEIDYDSLYYDYSIYGQFPCGAAYNGSKEGAPVVKVNSSWLKDNCPGWGLNRASNVNAWLQCLSSVLVPAIVFCLSIPRRRTLQFPHLQFVRGDYERYLILFFDLIIDPIFAIVDTIIWLCICFAFASPMMLSGLYEAMLDNDVLDYLAVKINENRLTLDMRCRCLMIILIGNLDLVWNTDIKNGSGGYVIQDTRDDNRLLDPSPPTSPWKHMEEYLYSLRLYDDDLPLRGHSPRQHAAHKKGVLHAGCMLGEDCHERAHHHMPIQWTPNIDRKIKAVKTELNTMLKFQNAFGPIVGAPVIFYLGGFLFTLVLSGVNPGDESTSLTLAFGQWYMVIPHIAIVSSILLAGNNPQNFETVVGTRSPYARDTVNILGLKYDLAYHSCYKVAWLWNRGHNKKRWLRTLIETYSERMDGTPREDMDQLKQRTTLSFWDWVLLLSLAMLLLGLPYTLAFLTAYYTPVIGVSCRSFTLTIYFSAQIGQIILWLWAYAGPLSVSNVHGLGFFTSGGWLDKKGFYRPYDVRWLTGNDRLPHNPIKLWRVLWNKGEGLLCWQFLWNSLYYLGQWMFGVTGVLAAIGGTLMQLVGVYSARWCRVTTSNWHKPTNKWPAAHLSQNTAMMIHYAKKTWVPCASVAIIFMALVGYFGWSYQKHMRTRFTDVVARIDDNECQEAEWSHPESAQTGGVGGESIPNTTGDVEIELLVLDLETTRRSGNR